MLVLMSVINGFDNNVINNHECQVLDNHGLSKLSMVLMVVNNGC